MQFTIEMQKAPWLDPTNINKQIRFGTARGLTNTAKEAQKAVVVANRGKFIIRNQWLEQSNKFGIRITPATKETLTAEVKTAAYWLPLQDKGGTKLPYKNWLAIPTTNVRPTPSALIPKALWPKNLKNSFEITTKAGLHLLCVRGVLGATKKGAQKLLGPRSSKGQSSDLLVMYVLVKKAKIQKVDIWEEPIRTVSALRLEPNVATAIKEAIASSK